jgi:hypothetical protein
VNDADTNIRVAKVFDEAMAIVREKNPRYGSSWRHQGWRGNLSRILEKAGRLRSMLWRRDPELLSASKEHPRETMLDMMNTLAFAIVNMDDGLEYGHEQPYDAPERLATGIPSHYTTGGKLHTHQEFEPCDQSCPAHPGAWPDAPHQLPQNRAGALQNPVPANEQTLVDVPVPGEEPPRPSPQPRVKVADHGSGPRRRPAKNAQA